MPKITPIDHLPASYVGILGASASRLPEDLKEDDIEAGAPIHPFPTTHKSAFGACASHLPEDFGNDDDVEAGTSQTTSNVAKSRNRYSSSVSSLGISQSLSDTTEEGTETTTHRVSRIATIPTSSPTHPLISALSVPIAHPQLYLSSHTRVDLRAIDLKLLLETSRSLPYTQEQEKIFEIAKEAFSRNQQALGCPGYTTIITVPTVLTAIGVFLPFHVAVIPITAIATVILSNVASMCLTGSIPSIESDEENKVQDEMGALESRFNDLSLYLLQAYTVSQESDRVFLREQCARISVETLKTRLEEAVPRKEHASTVFTQFEQVLEHITKATPLKSTYLEAMLYLFSKQKED